MQQSIRTAAARSLPGGHASRHLPDLQLAVSRDVFLIALLTRSPGALPSTLEALRQLSAETTDRKWLFMIRSKCRPDNRDPADPVQHPREQCNMPSGAY